MPSKWKRSGSSFKGTWRWHRNDKKHKPTTTTGPDNLCKAATDHPLPSQKPPEPEPMDIDGEDGWEVEKILTVRKIYNRLEYWVKWVSYDEDLVWYPAPNFIGSPHLVRHLHDENPTKPGPPLRLPEWLCAWEADNGDLQNTQMMTRWPRGRPSPWEVMSQRPALPPLI